MTSFEEGLRAAEEYRRAVEERYYEVYRYPLGPLPDGAQQVWCLPAGATEWERVGYTTEPIIGIDFGAPEPGETAVIAWPYKRGKTAFTATIQASPTDDMRALSDALKASHRASLDRRLPRLADDLGRWEPHVRHDFHKVQQVLEDAGIADGYGRLTIPQPVRPPVEPPAMNGQP